MRIQQKKSTDRAIYERAKKSSDPSMQKYVQWYEGGRKRTLSEQKPYCRKLTELLVVIMEQVDVDTVCTWSEDMMARATVWAMRRGERNYIKETTARTAFYKIRKAADEHGMDVKEFYERGSNR